MRHLAIAILGLLGMAAAQQQPRRTFGEALPHSMPKVMYQGCTDPAKIHSKEQFYRCEDAYLDGLIAKWQDQAKPGPKLVFSGNAQVLHAMAIARYPVETLKIFVTAMKESGAGRIDINPSPLAWIKPLPDTIAKYDAAIAEIRRQGMQISFNPTTFPGFDPPANYQGWQKESARMYAELARRYKPEVFSVMHEPWSMDRRLGEHVTPQQWREFVDAAVRLVKKESPNTKCVASFLPEPDVEQEVVKSPALDGVGLDIYHQFDEFQTFDRMIKMAKDAGKYVYIAETGRPMITFRDGILDFDAVLSIPDPLLQKLEPKWMKALTLYAITRGLEGVTEFWTAPFFAYDANTEDPRSKEYTEVVEKGMLSGARTPTFYAFQALAAKYGKLPAAAAR